MRLPKILFATSLLAAACGSDPETYEDPPPAEPEAVTEATELCMEGIQGNADVRAEAIDKLVAATEAYPDNARAFFFLGMCRLVTVAEDGKVGAASSADEALSRAHELSPDDARIAGNMWLMKFNLALVFHNQPKIDEATAGLEAAAEADPFADFVAALAFSQLEVESGYPQQAVDRLESLLELCPTLDYCKNSPIVLHHDPALYMQLGDAYVRIGDKANAVDAYAKAFTASGADTWTILEEAKAWAAAVDERILLHSDTDPSNDPEFFLGGSRTCSGCHG